MLFHSLYEEPEVYLNIIRVIAKKLRISRRELVDATKISDGGYLTARLRSLEEAGFIGSFLPGNHKRKGIHYKVIDEYTLFYFSWIEEFQKTTRGVVTDGSRYWESVMNKPTWFAWVGKVFEEVCFKHASTIRRKLELSIY